MTTVITGASGFLAAQLAAEIRSQSHEQLVGIDIRSSVVRLFDQAIVADLTDSAAALTALGTIDPRPERVFHLAGAFTGSDELVYASNARTTENVLTAMQRINPHARVAVAGSAAEYAPVPLAAQPVDESHVGKPSTPYGRAKARATAIAMAAAQNGQHVVVARPFNLIGPATPDTLVAGALVTRMRSVLASGGEQAITVGNTSAVRDFVDVRDVARGFVRALERGGAGRAYNLCTGIGHSIRELLNLLLDLAKRPITVRVDASLLRPDDVDVMVGAPGRAAAELDWRATISFAESVADLWHNASPT